MPTNHFKCFIVLLCSVLVSSCSYLEFILGAVEESMEDSKPYTAPEIRQIFADNYKELEALIVTCERNPKLRRIRLEGETEGFDDNKDHEFITKVRQSMRTIHVIGVSCERAYDLHGAPLMGVSFGVFYAGLGVSGISQRIYYKTEIMRKRFPQNIESQITLDKKGWSILMK